MQDEHAKRRLRVIEQTSASQIDAYERCPRKWFGGYVLGQREESSAAQTCGTILDDLHVQTYLRTGFYDPNASWWDALNIDGSTKVGKEIARIKADPERLQALEHKFDSAPKLGEILKALVPLLPKPSPELLVQHKIELDTFDGGPTVLGFADWVLALSDTHMHVGDLKSTSDFRYCKTEEELADNTQMIVYARAGYELLDAETVSIDHTYARTRGAAKARVVGGPKLILERSRVEDAYGRRVETVRDMVKVASSATSMLDLPPAPDAPEECNAFGGCAFRKQCGLINKPKPRGGMFKMANDNAAPGLLDRLRKAKEVPADAEAPPPPKEVASPPQEVKRNPFAKKAPAEPAPACATCGKPSVRQVTTGRGTGLLCATCEDLPAPASAEPARGVIPPDAPPREATPEEIEQVAAAKKPKKSKKDEEKVIKVKCPECGEKVPAKDFTTHFEVCSAKKEEPEPEPEPETKAEVVELRPKAEPVHDARPTVDAPPEPEKEPEPTAAEEIRAAEKRMGAKRPAEAPELYIDCMPVKDATGIAAVSLETWLAPIMNICAKAHDVPDWRLTDRYQARAILAVAIREALDTCPAVLVVDSRSPGSEVALEILIPHASFVARGLR